MCTRNDGTGLNVKVITDSTLFFLEMNLNNTHAHTGVPVGRWNTEKKKKKKFANIIIIFFFSDPNGRYFGLINIITVPEHVPVYIYSFYEDLEEKENEKSTITSVVFLERSIFLEISGGKKKKY